MTTAHKVKEEIEILQPDDSLSNSDLDPVHIENRTWNAWNFAALWISMAISIPAYMMASSLINGGMNVTQAVFTVFLGNVIVLIPMILNGHVGSKYGIPFPVFARLSFGVLGANIPAVLRAIVACGWFGIQTWIGGSAIYTILLTVFPAIASAPKILPEFIGISLIQFLCFFIFWSLNVYVIYRGIEAIKNFESCSAPILVFSGLLLLGWAFANAKGLNVILSSPSKFNSTADFLNFFFPALTGIVGYWATLSLNIPDFTRYAKNQKAQIVGQSIGLPASMTFIAFIGVAVTMSTFIVHGKYLWNPIDVIGSFENKLAIIFSMSMICLATLTTNIAANIVAPANDFSNLAPSKIDFKLGGLIAAVIGLVIMPWKLIADPTGYIFTWLIGYSALLGPIAGILLVDYFLIRKTDVVVGDLYRLSGRYFYKNGFNTKAVLAMFIGVVPNLPGFLSQINVLPSGYISKEIINLYNYAWFIGLFISGLIYFLLMKKGRELVK